MAANSVARAPPKDPPTTALNCSIPNASATRASARTMSRILTCGNEAPNSLSSTDVQGPVDPLHPPSTLVHTTKNSRVSIALPGPTTSSHQPGTPDAPEMTCESPVSACSTRIALVASALSVPNVSNAMWASGITSPFSVSKSPMRHVRTVPSTPCVSGLLTACGRKALLQVRNDVVHTFKAHAQADQCGVDA